MNNLGNKETMAENIQYYLDLHHKDRSDLCRDLGFKYTTVSNWLQAVKYPRIDKIELMAQYFGITKADLVEKRSDAGLPKSAADDIFDDHDIRALARKTLTGKSPEEIEKKKKKLKQMLEVMFDE